MLRNKFLNEKVPYCKRRKFGWQQLFKHCFAHSWRFSSTSKTPRIQGIQTQQCQKRLFKLLFRLQGQQQSSNEASNRGRIVQLKQRSNWINVSIKSQLWKVQDQGLSVKFGWHFESKSRHFVTENSFLITRLCSFIKENPPII